MPCIFGVSRILVLSGIATFESTARYEKCCELYTDIYEVCSQHRDVQSIKIPRPIWVDGRQQKNQKQDEQTKKIKSPIDDSRNFDFPPGFGNAYVEFEDVDSAIAAKNAIQGLNYDFRKVECHFWDP